MGNRFREKVAEEAVEKPRPEEVEPAAVDAAAGTDTPADTVDEAASAKGSKPSKALKGLAKLLGGDLLADRFVLRQVPLIMLCLIFLLLMVFNRYQVESLSREKLAVQERLNDLREHRIQMQKQYQKSVKISQIAEDLSATGVGITSGPPYEIEK